MLLLPPLLGSYSVAPRSARAGFKFVRRQGVSEKRQPNAQRPGVAVCQRCMAGISLGENADLDLAKLSRMALRLQGDVALLQDDLIVLDQFGSVGVLGVELRFLILQHDIAIDDVLDLAAA